GTGKHLRNMGEITKGWSGRSCCEIYGIIGQRRAARRNPARGRVHPEFWLVRISYRNEVRQLRTVRWTSLVALILGITLLFGTLASAQVRQLSVVTGGTGGVYYVLGGGL